VITNVVNGVFVEKVCRDDLFDDLFQDLLPQVLGGDVVRVLSRNDDSVDSEGNNGTTVAFVLDRHLGLGVWSEPGEGAGPSGDSQSLVQFVGKNNGERHQFRGFRSGISEHETLITGTVVFERALVETLGNVGRLLFNGDKDVAGLVIETLRRVVIPNVPDGFSDNLLVVYLGLGRDFTEDHDHSGLGSGLASDLGVWVLFQAGIELCGVCQRD